MTAATAVLAPPRPTLTADDVTRSLDVVMDPELDEPITDLGFVRSVVVDREGRDGATVTVHLRLPTSFCSPSFAYLMASDSKDAIGALPGVVRVVVELDDHHDSEIINRGLAADAGWCGTFADEAEHGLDELRATFRRKAHTAAMERCLTRLLRARDDLAEDALGEVRLGDLPDEPHTEALRRRREALGLPLDDGAVVMVDHEGRGHAPGDVPMALRRARSTRISIDGNAHFCRGLLATRYPGAEDDQVPRADGADPTAFVPLSSLTTRPTTEEPSR